MRLKTKIVQILIALTYICLSGFMVESLFFLSIQDVPQNPMPTLRIRIRIQNPIVELRLPILKKVIQVFFVSTSKILKT